MSSSLAFEFFLFFFFMEKFGFSLVVMMMMRREKEISGPEINYKWSSRLSIMDQRAEIKKKKMCWCENSVEKWMHILYCSCTDPHNSTNPCLMFKYVINPKWSFQIPEILYKENKLLQITLYIMVMCYVKKVKLIILNMKNNNFSINCE